MNIFKKIALINKITKKAKAVKKYLDSTHIDDELKEIIASLKSDIQKLINKVPDAKGLVEDLLDIIKL